MNQVSSRGWGCRSMSGRLLRPCQNAGSTSGGTRGHRGLDLKSLNNLLFGSWRRGRPRSPNRLTYGYSLPGLARYPVILTNLGDQRIPYELQNPGPRGGEGKETGLVLRLRSVVLGLRSCSQPPLRRSSNPARSQADRQGGHCIRTPEAG